MEKPLIIAEAGVNHNGDLLTALRLIDTASSAGADYIKFQTFKAESLVTHNSETADYQKENCGESSQLEMLRKLELSFDDFKRIAAYCHEKEIGFLSTPFDFESIEFLDSMNMDFFKIPSGEIDNFPYLEKIALTGKPVIISTGMATPEEIADCLEIFYNKGYSKDKITLLHCTTQYPAPLKDVNLRAMITLRETFGISTGYSDHTKGIEVAVAATALGAKIIEKHFTLSRAMEGPDHKASLEPQELSKMIEEINNVALALGDGIKRIAESEKLNRRVARKSIVAAKFIKKGEIFTESNLTVKRPGTGLSPKLWHNILGKVSDRDYKPDQLIVF